MACSFIISFKDLISWIRCLIRVEAKLCRTAALQELSSTPLIYIINLPLSLLDVTDIFVFCQLVLGISVQTSDGEVKRSECILRHVFYSSSMCITALRQNRQVVDE